MSAYLVKIVVQLLTQLFGDKETRRKVLSGIIGGLLVLLIIPTLFLTVPGVLGKSVRKDLDGTEAVYNYEIYQDVQTVYDAYIAARIREKEELAEELRWMYSYEQECNVYVWDAERQEMIATEETYIETIYPEVYQSFDITRPEARLLMAYVATKQFYDSQYKVNASDAYPFLEYVMIDRTTYMGWDPIYLDCRYQVRDVDTIADYFFPQQNERELFELLYQNLSEMEE